MSYCQKIGRQVYWIKWGENKLGLRIESEEKVALPRRIRLTINWVIVFMHIFNMFHFYIKVFSLLLSLMADYALIFKY